MRPRSPPASTSVLFPYSTLFRSLLLAVEHIMVAVAHGAGAQRGRIRSGARLGCGRVAHPRRGRRDRKSTRLNSSHITTSYAVFCLKKKNSTHVIPLNLPVPPTNR